jgi:hypothetical protein
MPKFDLKEIIKGRQTFYQLTIDDNPDYAGALTDAEKNDRKTGVLDIYEENLEAVYEKDIQKIHAYIERVANNQPVPGDKFHDLTDRPKNDLIVDYEFKSGDLRVYCFKITGGKVVVVGGYKNNQDADIRKCRSLKKQFFEQLNQK